MNKPSDSFLKKVSSYPDWVQRLLPLLQVILLALILVVLFIGSIIAHNDSVKLYYNDPSAGDVSSIKYDVEEIRNHFRG